MKKTLFAGLTVLEPGEGLGEDNGAFIRSDREIIDRLLEIGAKTHRHDGTNGLSNPAIAPIAAVVASGGSLRANLGISVGYTLEDSVEGETMLSPVATVSTPLPTEQPQAAPSAKADYTAGGLMVNTYFYAVTFTDGEGGETPLGPSVSVERAPGYASGRVILTNLNYGMTAAGAKGWRLYRATGGGTFDLLATGTGSEFIDDGSVSPNCDIHPLVGEENTTSGTSTLLVTLPSAGLTGVSFINIYATTTNDFGGGSFLGQYPVASAGRTVAFTALEQTDASPPPVNLSIGGAHQIDPDTELLDWHWKRPVAASAALGSGVLGDVRLAEDSGNLYAVLSASASAAPGWTRIGSAAAASSLMASAASLAVSNVTEIDFTASGSASISVQQTAAGRALVTVGTSAVPPLKASAASVLIAPITEIDFTASGGLGLALREVSPGKALVTVGSTPGGTGSANLSASGITGVVGNLSSMTFAPSGWLQAAVTQQVTGSAKVQVFPSAAIDLVEAAQIANFPENWMRWLSAGNPSKAREEIWGANRNARLGQPDAFAELYLWANRLRQAAVGMVHLAAANASGKVAEINLLAEQLGQGINFTVGAENLLLLSDEGLSRFMQLDSSRKVVDYGLVESLPKAPTIGSRCQFIADKTNGIIWDLLYDGEGEYPWKKIGGPPLFAEVATEEATKSTTYTALATAGPTLTPPLKGDYDVEVGAGTFNSNTIQANLYMSYAIGNSAAVDADSVEQKPIQGTGSAGSRLKRKAGLAASAALVAKYRTTSGEAFFVKRWMRIDPIRVG